MGRRVFPDWEERRAVVFPPVRLPLAALWLNYLSTYWRHEFSHLLDAITIITPTSPSVGERPLQKTYMATHLGLTTPGGQSVTMVSVQYFLDTFSPPLHPEMDIFNTVNKLK